jgi:uncharacterized phage protein gp47/JayE
MMTTQWGLTPTGFYVPSLDEIQTKLRAEYEARIGMSIDWTPENALTDLTAVYAARVHEGFVALGAIYDGTDPDTATGYQLDAICTISGVRRLAATFSTVTLTLSGDVGITVPAGKQVEDSERQRWIITEDATIGSGGTVDVIARASETGPVTIGAGEVTIIVTPVFGWLSVTNAAAAVPGRARETDGELRQRRQLSLQQLSGGSLKGIRRKLLELPFLRSATVLENDTDAPATVAGMTVPAHSVVPILYSRENNGQLTEPADRIQVARALYASVVAGVKCYGEDDSAQVIGGDGVAKTIEWSYATAVTVNVGVTLFGVSASTWTDTVEDVVEDYFDNLFVGDTVRRLPLILAIANAIPGLQDVEVLLNGVDADVVLTETQLGALGTVTVTA